MLRYIVTAAIAALVLAVAIKSRSSESPANSPTGEEQARVVHESPEVSVTEVPGGMAVRVKHCFAGSVSRASLVYDYQGEYRTVDEITDCQKSLASSSGLRNDGYTSEVDLRGTIPHGASDLQIVAEDETGTQILPVVLD
jgi:hypothetical protein